MSSSREALSWAVGALVLFGATASRTVGWADSSKLTLYALHGYVPSLNPGDHPGWTVLARLWLALSPLAPTVALPLLSAASGAVAVGAVFALLVRRVDRGTARSATAVLLLSHSLWWSATLTESYAPALALALGAALLADVDRGPGRRAAAGLVAGLGAAAHPFSLVVSVPWLVSRRLDRWGPALVGMAVGTGPVWLGVLGVPPDPLTGHVAGTGTSWGWHVSAFLDPRQLGVGAVRLAAMVVFAVGPVAVAALARQRRDGAHPRARAAVVLLAAYAVLVSLYAPFRVHVMALFLVAGLVLVRPPRLSAKALGVHALVQLVLYVALPLGLVAAGYGDLGVRRLPRRVNAAYFLCPVKSRDDGAERYAEELLAAAPVGATILADFNPGAALALARELGGARSDLELLPTFVDEALARPDPAAVIAARARDELAAGRPVVLADSWEPYYRTRELTDRFGLPTTPCGPGVRLELP